MAFAPPSPAHGYPSGPPVPMSARPSNVPLATPRNEFDGLHSEMSEQLAWLPHAESMEVTNDPRFMSNNVISKRLIAFQTITVVATLMVNLAVKQMFLLEKNVHLNVAGVIQFSGFTIMTIVFLMDLFSVVVLVQQLFMTYRLLTAGPTGFEIAKSYYLNPNIVTMRHLAVRGFLFSLPLFVASTSCMIFVVFNKAGHAVLAIPACVLLVLASLGFWWVNSKHSVIFKERYLLAKSYEQPLLSHVDAVSSRTRSGGSWMGVDV